MEELLAKQRKEKKALKEKTLAMKKAAKSGNKQKQKETASEIEQLEKETAARHERELEELKSTLGSESVASSEEVESSSTMEADTDEAASFYKEKNVKGKIQKRQAKKEEQARRMAEALKEDRANASSSLRFIELEALSKALDSTGLQLVDIAPDGDCLYNAVAHQLSRTSGFEKITGADLRRRAARFILENKDEFAPFLTNDNGDPLDEFELEDYCNKVEQSVSQGGVWGGEPELNALSRSLERNIQVIQPEGRLVSFGADFSSLKPLTIVYHRHAYQLGEHYNSTQPRTATAE